MKNLDRMIIEGSNKLGIEVDEHRAGQMVHFAKELLVWNKKINLTAITKPEEIAEKHFVDSIVPVQYIKNGSKILDMGTGAGFPGIVLKIMNPSLHITLVDSVRKKINFVRQVIRLLKLDNIQAVHSRIEEIQKTGENKQFYDMVISRAFTELPGFVRLAKPFLKPDGYILAMKGPSVELEITPDIDQMFDIQNNDYLLPKEQAERRILQLKFKQEV